MEPAQICGAPCAVLHDPAEVHFFETCRSDTRQQRYMELCMERPATDRSTKTFFTNILHNASPLGRVETLGVLQELKGTADGSHAECRRSFYVALEQWSEIHTWESYPQKLVRSDI